VHVSSTVRRVACMEISNKIEDGVSLAYRLKIKEGLDNRVSIINLAFALIPESL